jgi:modification methylase
VDVAQLLAAGVIVAGTRLNPGKHPVDALAEVLPDGRIRTFDGQVFAALSPAGAHVRGTKASPGWDFWHVEREGALVPMKLLRDEFLRTGR